MRLRTRICKN